MVAVGLVLLEILVVVLADEKASGFGVGRIGVIVMS